MSSLEDGIRMLLTEVDENSKIIKFDKINAEDNFTLLLRTKLRNQESWGKTCNNWMQKFTIQTNSKWVVKATFPKVQRMEYRKVYICKENNIRNRNLNRSCNGKIDIKIKKITPSTLKKDCFLQKGYNTEIKIIFDHSHDRS